MLSLFKELDIKLNQTQNCFRKVVCGIPRLYREINLKLKKIFKEFLQKRHKSHF